MQKATVDKGGCLLSHTVLVHGWAAQAGRQTTLRRNIGSSATQGWEVFIGPSHPLSNQWLPLVDWVATILLNLE